MIAANACFCGECLWRRDDADDVPTCIACKQLMIEWPDKVICEIVYSDGQRELVKENGNG